MGFPKLDEWRLDLVLASILSQKAALVDLVLSLRQVIVAKPNPEISAPSDGPALVAGRGEYVENHRRFLLYSPRRGFPVRRDLVTKR